jgi:cobalt/nickel transport system ATP-binding protein
MIEVRDLTFIYPDGRAAIQYLSLSIQKGESVGLIGPNGAGKTTLFLCLCGVHKVKAGCIQIGGCDPSQPGQRRELPKQVGIVFQNSDDQLFSATVFDDVAFGPLNYDLPPEEVKKRVTESLACVGMSGSEERVPFHLSGGEKRRVALAGILAMRPAVLLLDEPSMFLDPRSRRGLIQLIQGLPDTKVIASHDLALIRETCSRVLMMDEGKLVADGPSAEVLGNRELMQRHGLEM